MSITGLNCSCVCRWGPISGSIRTKPAKSKTLRGLKWLQVFSSFVAWTMWSSILEDDFSSAWNFRQPLNILTLPFGSVVSGTTNQWSFQWLTRCRLSGYRGHFLNLSGDDTALSCSQPPWHFCRCSSAGYCQSRRFDIWRKRHPEDKLI